ncbi:ABC transporter ATP-binding protein, partial [Streptomyces klenkii]
MEITAWNALYNARHAQDDRHPFSRDTLRRIGRFARPHRGALVAFLLLSVVTALLAVATPVLAGQVVNALTEGSARARVVRLAVLIAAIALAEAGVGLLARW